MADPPPVQVLIVAHRTAATPQLLTAVAERVARGPARFTLLVPRAAPGLRVTDAEDVGEELVLALALPLLEDVVGAEVEGITGDADPVVAIQAALRERVFEEIIISTLPSRVSRWLRLDLPTKVAALGLPVTTVTAPERRHVPTGITNFP
jgi:hypothetical protein